MQLIKKILPATEMRQNLREVLESLGRDGEPYYLTQRSQPKAVLCRYDEYESLSRKAKESEELGSALRWALGFIANFGLAMESQKDPAAYVQVLKTAIHQGLQRGHVPQGVMSGLDDVESMIKEWDYRTFRLHEGMKLLEQTEDRVIVGRTSCPVVFDAMRRQAPFHIKHMGPQTYKGAFRESPQDFLCVCCSLCCRGLVEWLSGGRLQVAEVSGPRDEKSMGICAYAVRDERR